MEKVTRRTFVETAMKSSILTLRYALPTGTLFLTAAEARERKLPLLKLTAAEGRQLELLGEAIVPGSTACGLLHFVDHQLAASPNEALLIAKYFEVAPPFLAFYAHGLRASAGLAADGGAALEKRDKVGMKALISEMSKPGAMHDGFPISLFYMCLRSDAIDVVYGTPEGFKKLNIPYMQHIMPPEHWDA